LRYEFGDVSTVQRDISSTMHPSTNGRSKERWKINAAK
jgi:hypothetical protein